MMKNNNLFVAILVLPLLMGCEDFFESSIDVDPPEFTERLVLNIDESFDTGAIQVRLSKNINIFEPYLNDQGNSRYKDDRVKDGNISVSINGLQQEVQKFKSDLYTHFFTLDSPLQPMDVVNVTAEYFGFETVFSEITIPNSLKIINAKLGDQLQTSAFGDSGYPISFNILNNSQEAAYVELRVFEEIKSTVQHEDGSFTHHSHKQMVQIETSDPYAVNNYYGTYLDDKSFPNADSEINFVARSYRFSSHPDFDKRFFIELNILSKKAYDYKVSLTAYYNAVDNPFSSAVNVRGNVENGYGLVSIYQRDTLWIE